MHASFSLFSNQLANDIYSVERGVLCLLSCRLIFRFIRFIDRLIPAFRAQPFRTPLPQLLMPRNIFSFVVFRTSAANDTSLFSSRSPPVENSHFCYTCFRLAFFLWVSRPRTTSRAFRLVIHGLHVVDLGLPVVDLEPKPCSCVPIHIAV